MEELVRVRIAPSPTGKFHFGVARVAIFNYLFAKKFGGKFILRIEDTDRERSTIESETDIIECLKWLGLDWDEGPMVDGPYGPYRQSERGEIYREYIDSLVQSGAAYYCFCSPEELAKEREEQEKKKLMPRYSGKCRDLTKEQVQKNIADGKKYVIRFRIPEEKVVFTDLIKGVVEFDMSNFGDFVIVGSDNNPLFLLTNSIDDAFMKITHVLRGDDHLSNTPKQILLMQAMNLLPPEYGHLPTILNTDKTKMSKRNNPVSITDDYKNNGYLPEALINFMVLLGWHPTDDNELFSLDDLETDFSLDRVSKSPAIFDIKKLEFMNGHYIRKRSLGDLAELCLPFLEKSNPEHAKLAKANANYYLQAIGMIQDRMRRLDQVASLIHFFFDEMLDYSTDLLIPSKSNKEDIARNLMMVRSAIERMDVITREALEIALMKVIREMNISNGELLWPLRVAVTGEKFSPNVFELIEAMGKERSLKRITAAIEKLESGNESTG